jgi:hypothetical protein
VFTDIGWVAERFKAAVLKCVADRNPVQSEPRQFAEIRHFLPSGRAASTPLTTKSYRFRWQIRWQNRYVVAPVLPTYRHCRDAHTKMGQQSRCRSTAD